MFNEGLWIFLAFVFLLGISFKYIKKGILTTLDGKIKSIESSIVNAEDLKKSSQEKLLSLKKDYEKALVQYESAIEEAKVEAQRIIKDTENKVKLLDEKSTEIISEYRKQSDIALIESFKGDILMTILNLLESEQKGNNSAQLKSVEDSLNILKKMWN